MTPIVKPKFELLGWKTYVQNRKGTSKIRISKLVATGAGLSGGEYLYCYLARDPKERPIIVVYLDGEPKDSIKESNPPK